MMKRALWLPFLIGMMLVLAACGAADAPATDSGAEEENIVEPTAVPIVEEAVEEEAEDTAVSPSTTTEDPFDVVATLRDDDWTKGTTDSPLITIIDYSDFQCPACSAVAPMLARLVEEHPDEVLIAYRHFPLDNIHPFAGLVGEASEAAGAQGEFWLFHDAIYENQSELNNLTTEEEVRAFLIDAADDLGLNVTRFTADLDSGVYTELVAAEQNEAIQAGLPGTPALIVNGQLLQGAPPYEAWVDFLSQLRQMAVLEELQYDSAPEMSIDETAQYFATVTMADGAGEFVIELLPQSAPLTVNNFVFLANEGWFDGVTFHRVLPDFVAQTGDPTGTGMGGPGYEIPNEIDPNLTHAEVGMVAMANSGPDTNGSQWYVTLGDAAFLDGGYTIFGRVIEGMEVVQAITPRDPQMNPNAPDGDRIESVTIRVGE